MRNFDNSLGILYFKLNKLCTVPPYSPILWKRFLILQALLLNLSLAYLSSNFSPKIQQFFALSYDFNFSFVNYFILYFSKLVIILLCFFKHSQNFFIKYLPTYISCLFFMSLNDDIVDIILQIIFQDYFYTHLFFKHYGTWMTTFSTNPYFIIIQCFENYTTLIVKELLYKRKSSFLVLFQKVS